MPEVKASRLSPKNLIEPVLPQTTIIALASGAGPAGVSIVRVSGPQSGKLVQKLAGNLPEPRRAVLRALVDDAGDIIDKALVLWFPAPASFTGEDVVEFHVHGGRAVVSDVVSACLKLKDVVLARPGEFTRRGFENGKMDLSAAEGLGDLIDAETGAQRKQALRQMDGALADEVLKWRETIIDALAQAEGDIDFPDEDMPPGLDARTRETVLVLKGTLEQHLQDSQKAIRVRDGFRVAIMGAPNAGKSSLINALVRRDAAIVSPIAGTTRDIVEARLIIGGMVVLIGDTAGLRETVDAIEAEGVKRALSYSETADLRLALIGELSEIADLSHLMREGDIWLLAKADLGKWSKGVAKGFPVSSLTGDGIDELESEIGRRAGANVQATQTAPLTRLRHIAAVSDTVAHLSRALNAQGSAAELIAEDLRLAARSLSQIVGRVDMDDVLDRLFAQFCIGK